MSLLDILLKAEAAERQAAVRRTGYLHRHVGEEPLVVCAYNLSGEAAAPLGIVWGTARDDPTFAVAAEPRNRDVRFAAINKFSKTLYAFLQPYLVLVEQETSSGWTKQVAEDVPQLVFPNVSTRDYMTTRLGRSLRYLGLGKTFPAPIETQWAGAHLTWFSEQSRLPGQSVALAATELLKRHFSTGQSSLEDENLATLLAWIENVPGRGLDRILAAEQELPFGPVPDPDWEADIEPEVRAFSKALRDGKHGRAKKLEKSIAKIVKTALTDAYHATHRALDIARQIQPAEQATKRWAGDLRAWSTHAWVCSQYIPRRKKRHDPLRAAKLLEQWSQTLDHLDADEAFDDPLVMAAYDAEGNCVSGVVEDVNLDNREVKPGNKRRTLVPLVWVKCPGSTLLLEGTRVIWADDRGVVGVIRQIDERGNTSQVLLAIMGGHARGTRLPGFGSNAVFAALEVFGGQPPGSPDDVPWTHRPGAAPSHEKPRKDDPQTSADETDLGPDLAPTEVLALPSGDVTDPDEIPGVVS